MEAGGRGVGVVARRMLTLAVLEYINYFVVQLSHETRADLRRLVRTRRLHPSHLAIDLRRHR